MYCPCECETHYCTPQDVAETLGLPVPGGDPSLNMPFSDHSVPTEAQVIKMILSNEDRIDRRIRLSWRENYVKDHLINIPKYQWDENAWRSAYYIHGGNQIQLHKNILPWDPEKGDKLEMRLTSKQWIDITDAVASEITTDEIRSTWAWFDYPKGRLFIRTGMRTPSTNSIRISYRHGLDEPVPYAISRACVLMTAMGVLDNQMFSVKLGMGGDISGIKREIRQAYQEEINDIFTSYQTSGAVVSMIQR